MAPGSEVGLDPSTFLLDYTNTAAFQDITLAQETYADVSGNGGGTFQVQGRNVSLLDNSVLEASNLGPTDGGTVTIRASEQLEVMSTDGSDIAGFIVVNVFDRGQGSHLVMETGQLLLGQGALITTDTFAEGASGGMTINANDVLILGNPNIDSVPTILASGTFDAGQGGDITFNADRLETQGNTLVAVDVLGIGPDAGDGGELRLNVDELVLQSGQVSTSTFGDGNSGDLIVTAADLVLRDGAQVATSTFGNGDAGNLVIRATNSVTTTGVSAFSFSGDVFSSGLYSSAELGSTGNAGNLSIATPRLSVVEGGKVAVNTLGEGDGGSITIRADDIEVADPIVDFGGAVSGLVANAVGGSTGNGGSLDIAANRLRVYNGGQITASTDGAGDAGTINIQATEIDLSGQSDDGLPSTITTNSSTDFAAGSINLTGRQISVRDGAVISVSSTGGGDSGNLNVLAEELYLNNGTIQADVTAGSEGNLDLRADRTLLMRPGKFNHHKCYRSGHRWQYRFNVANYRRR
ncbi:MAG: hypothetical protein AAFY20_19710 [Cyanobacteria bacterium J06639_14]